MQRIKDDFLEHVEKIVSLQGLVVLEIGCGNGARSEAIARRCKLLHAIEPDEAKVNVARTRNIPNTLFHIGSATDLPFEDRSFDVILFTLSLHHIPANQMERAINEAIRTVSKTGYIIFLEPTETGSFFEAEIQFEACDGDERKEKAAAYIAMMNHRRLQSIQEIDDETIFQFHSVEDFIETMAPKKGYDNIKRFLESHNYILNADRRINIFQPGE